MKGDDGGVYRAGAGERRDSRTRDRGEVWKNLNLKAIYACFSSWYVNCIVFFKGSRSITGFFITLGWPDDRIFHI